MKKIFVFTVVAMLLLAACNETEKIELFGGDNFDNWIIFLPDSIEQESVFHAEEGKLYVGGIPNGYIRTKEEYDSYELHLEWRWMEDPKNSGILLHATGEDVLWPNCIEAQLMAGKAGDFVLIGKGAGITVQDTAYLVESEENRIKVIPKFEESSELAPGQWNSYDIKVTKEEIELKVNGVIQNLGTAPTKSKGSICIQSEGGPLEFRNIYLTPIK
ncbi:MAG: DUF1080 domain-containing protein [Bacteroidales bacterium]